MIPLMLCLFRGLLDTMLVSFLGLIWGGKMVQAFEVYLRLTTLALRLGQVWLSYVGLILRISIKATITRLSYMARSLNLWQWINFREVGLYREKMVAC
ncbi:hypothetical protein GWI33_020748 [Rhynchophorus ferrugineus]|uniref:Uncharacterized protein n=1 Tax=Rhynchophorus ferrugineus TaxID=354439 RepID=A0A834M5B3_RHYFE|nr:hypothetical protein GWI33_020748 [Rhynchophorus ferrugineus]